MSESNTRAEVVEVMARGACRAACSKPACDCTFWVVHQVECDLALTALEASGRAVVPRETVDTLDEHIGALLRIFEDAPVQNEADAERVLQIATAFGERCLAAALPPRSE